MENQFAMNFSPFMVTNKAIVYGELIPPNFLPKENYLIRALLYSRRKFQNSFVLIVGKPRTGKSAFAIKLCERIAELENREFNLDKQLTFDNIEKFLTWSQDAIDSEFILDETGTTLSPDQFWSLYQRIMRRFVQTQGFRENIVIWVLPIVRFLQKNFSFMCDYAVRTYRRTQGIVSLHKIVIDELLGKGDIYPMKITVKFDLPSDKIWLPYIKMKKEWNDKTLKQDINWLEQIKKANQTNDYYTNRETGSIVFSPRII